MSDLRLDTLAASRLFSSMSREDLALVEGFLETRQLAPGEVLFREGEVGSELYVVRSGAMSSWVAQDDGSRRELYGFHPGDHIVSLSFI